MSFPSLKDQQPPLDPGSLDPNINIVFSICLKNKCRYLWMQILLQYGVKYFKDKWLFIWNHSIFCNSFLVREYHDWFSLKKYLLHYHQH